MCVTSCQAFPYFAMIVWGVVLYLFEEFGPFVHGSLRSTMTVLYHDANSWSSISGTACARHARCITDRVALNRASLPRLSLVGRLFAQHCHLGRTSVCAIATVQAAELRGSVRPRLVYCIPSTRAGRPPTSRSRSVRVWCDSVTWTHKVYGVDLEEFCRLSYPKMSYNIVIQHRLQQLSPSPLTPRCVASW